MGKQILLNVRLFAGGADVSGSTNKAEVTAEVDEQDVTNYRSNGWKESLGGLASSSISAEGQWEAGDPSFVDDQAWSLFGGVGPWTVCPNDATVGALAYTTNALHASYTLGGSVGDVAPYQAKADGSWPMVRGQIAHPPGTPRTADGTGTGLNLGAVAAGKRLYASLHVLSATGTTPSLTARIESDTDNTWATPVTVFAFNAATAAGGQIMRSSGTALTDSWFRLAWTITGTSPSFLLAAAVGIA